MSNYQGGALKTATGQKKCWCEEKKRKERKVLES
jgi:hypothetical protein